MTTTADRPATARVSAMLADAFRAEGVRDLFGVMGNGNMEFVPHFMDLDGCRFFSFRHEFNAVLAAEGYSRVTGRVGVATVTYGPGITHAATSLVTASRG